MEKSVVLSHCDHTLLGVAATGKNLKLYWMMRFIINVLVPVFLQAMSKQAKEYVQDKLAICTVIGFPNGYQYNGNQGISN